MMVTNSIARKFIMPSSTTSTISHIDESMSEIFKKVDKLTFSGVLRNLSKTLWILG